MAKTVITSDVKVGPHNIELMEHFIKTASPGSAVAKNYRMMLGLVDDYIAARQAAKMGRVSVPQLPTQKEEEEDEIALARKKGELITITCSIETVDYGEIVEYGSPNHKPKPFIRPAVDLFAGQIRSLNGTIEI
jgi:hypothetical protein